MGIKITIPIKFPILVFFGFAWILGFTNPAIAYQYRGLNPAGSAKSILLKIAPRVEDPLNKIEPLVLDQLEAEGATDFFVWIDYSPDLKGVEHLTSKAARGQYIYSILQRGNQQSQAGVIALLDGYGVKYQTFTVVNRIFIQGATRDLALEIASRPEVKRMTANHIFQLDPFKASGNQDNRETPGSILAAGSNITFIKADQVWARGITGQGIVLAGHDSGIQWDHPAIKNQYRGWNGSSANHNYNWWDATATYPEVPGDGNGHGTHTAGTMVGDDGGSNQIGVAPGARLIACKNLTDSGSGSDAFSLTCFDWFLAPWDLNHANPNPLMAPDAINNSWGDQEGNNLAYAEAISNLQAAGILVEVSAGNNGPACQTLASPGDYDDVLTTGSISFSNPFPGSIAMTSSRGPSEITAGAYVPDVMAPGENVRSSLPGSTYGLGSGTSMAGPHVTGLVALLWSANPSLRGQVAETVDLIKTKAIPLTDQGGSNCGGDYKTGPNNDWGKGTIDALATVANIVIVNGPIQSDTTWIDGNTYYVNGDATVANGVILTVQPGAVVKFAPQRRLVILGKLLVSGTQDQPVFFTSYRDDSVGVDIDGTPGTSGSRGDWGWIEFAPSSDDSSTISYAVIRYGGYSSAGNPAYAGTVTLRDASPTLQNSTIGSSTENGVYIESSVMGASQPTLAGSSFTANDTGAVSMDPTSLVTLEGNTATGNGTNGVNLRGGAVTSSVTWDQSNLPYRLVGTVNVNAGATLTIGPDMIFKGNPSQRLVISGKLLVNGSPGHEVHFTSYRDDNVGGDTDGGGASSGTPGDWGWIEFAPSSDDSSTVSYAVIRYGGYSSAGNPSYAGTVTLRDTSPTLQNCTIGSSTENGVYIESSVMGASQPTLAGSSLTANDTGAVSMDPTSLVTLEGNTATGNGTNGVNIRGGAVTSSVTWDQSNLPYRLVGTVNVNAGATLTIGPDMIFKGNPSQRLVISGGLLVNGSPGHEVHFTSYRDDNIGGDTDGGGASSGRAGDWGWIEFAPSSDDSSTISYAVIRYGGYSSAANPAYAGNVTLRDASPVLRESTITFSIKNGIDADMASPVMTCNNILGNTDYGIFNSTPQTIVIATTHWWGSGSGPNHPTINPSGTGDRVSDGVEFIPWLTSSCQTPPAAPSNLAATVFSENEIGLNWQDNSIDETTFHIESSPDGSTNWQEIGVEQAGVTTFVESGLACSSQPRFYRVRAYRDRDGQYSGYSNAASSATPPCAPSNLTVTAVSQSEINLNWQDNSPDETQFMIERSDDGITGWALIAAVGADTTGYSDQGLSCDTRYHYRIRALREGDDQYSDYSDPANAATYPCPRIYIPFVQR